MIGEGDKYKVVWHGVILFPSSDLECTLFWARFSPGEKHSGIGLFNYSIAEGLMHFQRLLG